MRVLYISHNGMLENLGQAQVLPYCRGLARRGVDIHIFSFELETATVADREALASNLRADGIRWSPLVRRRDPRFRTKLLESSHGIASALATAATWRPDIVHGRSYLPTAVADFVASVVPRARLLFDCRGMVGDEYVDAGYWTKDRFEYKLVKKYEQRAFRRADGVVVLTERLRRVGEEARWFGPRTTVAVVPCCVDLDRFRFDPSARARRRAELGLDDHLVVTYSGSLGGWYQEPELARFAGLVRRAAARPVAFLLLTHQPAAELRRLLRDEGFHDEEIVVRKVPPAQMFEYLSAGDLALSFIKSCFSKLGSSPTKVAEYLACGLPTVLNGDIGDQADLAAEGEACVVVDALTTDALTRAVPRALALAERSTEERVRLGRAVARRRFGLEEVGVQRYARLYDDLVRSARGSLGSRVIQG